MKPKTHQLNKIALLGALWISLSTTPAATAYTSPSPDNEGWENIFNGKDLTGWSIKFTGYVLGENYKDTFHVTDETIKVSYDKYDHFNGEFGHLFYNTPYSSYRLRFDYRFFGEQTPGGPGWAFRNSGVMVHSQSAESMTLNQEFPVSIEVQLLGQTGAGTRPTGNVCTPGTHIVLSGMLEKEHCINSTSPTFKGDGWVTAEVEVLAGKSIRHFINNKLVMEYSAPQLDSSEVDTQHLLSGGNNDDMLLKSGYIAFQAESHPVEFKNIKILQIDE